MKRAAVPSILVAVVLLALGVMAEAQQAKKVHRIAFLAAPSPSFFSTPFSLFLRTNRTSFMPMEKDILICLQALEWIRLEPHLPSDVCESLTEDERGMPMLEGRIVPDDATYQRILDIARTHCPEIVKHIEKERQKSLTESG